MSTRNIIIVLLLASFIQYGCKKEEIQVYDAANYVQFASSYQDTINMSFFFYPNQDHVDLPVPVRLIGKMPENGLSFKLAVDQASSTALSTYYAMPETFLFRTGQPLDTAYITVNKTPEMTDKEFILAVDVVAFENVLPGQTEYTRRILRISNMVRKPAWWDTNMNTLYLGVYSEAKYRKFMEVTGVGDLPAYETYEQRNFMLQFKYYLIQMRDEGTPVLEADGSDMLSTIPLIG